jgi:hypothetical protein
MVDREQAEQSNSRGAEPMFVDSGFHKNSKLVICKRGFAVEAKSSTAKTTLRTPPQAKALEKPSLPLGGKWQFDVGLGKLPAGTPKQTNQPQAADG